MHRLRATLFALSLAIILLVIILSLSNTAAAKFSAHSDQDFQPKDSISSGPYSSIETEQIDPLRIALDYIDGNIKTLGLSEGDTAELAVSDQYNSKNNGVTHIYLIQRLNGIDVYNAIININVLPDGTVLNYGNRAVSNLQDSANTTTPLITAEQAVSKTADALGLETDDDLFEIKSFRNTENTTLFTDGGISLNPIPTRLIYQPTAEGAVRLAWETVIYELSADHWWSVRLDAVTGEVLSTSDWVVQDNWSGKAESQVKSGMDKDLISFDNESNVVNSPASPDSYTVFALPKEYPDDGARSAEVNPADATASPFGWHDTNGAAGAEYTITRGNNAHAYLDPSEKNESSGDEPDGGSSLIFNFALDLADEPTDYEDAAVTNLFYWNNIIHDLTYQYGFDEAAGNFQSNNYGNSGSGGDWVQAEAHDKRDFGFRNNANFSTPPDGSKPRMQMYLWNQTDPERDGDLSSGIIIHEYGHGLSNRLTGGPSLAGCLQNDEQMGEGWSDFETLAFTAVSSDTGPLGRGIGTYALGQSTAGQGIRDYRYSTNFAVNPHTYDDIKSTGSSPHDLGEVWATMLWEMYWELVDEYGFDSDLYSGSGGNNLAIQLVSDGMKLQPCSPGFVDGRDAILAADVANNSGANQCFIWDAFARRGLGYSADQGSSNNRTDGTEAFDLPDGCNVGIAFTPKSVASQAYGDVSKTEYLTISNHGANDLDWILQEAGEFESVGEDNFIQDVNGIPPNLTYKLDDGSSEVAIGDNSIQQFIWFNRFTPEAEEFPLTLNEIWVQFNNWSPDNGDTDIFVFEDKDQDGDPATGTSLVAKFDSTIQHNDGAAWSKYELNPAVTLEGPGDILIGVANKYSSAPSEEYPAQLDTSLSHGRSWVATYTSGSVPESPTFPGTESWGTIDSFGFPGNWMIRAYGYRNCDNLTDVDWLGASPTAGTIGASGNTLVDISLDSTDLNAGDHVANLCINSSDLRNSLVTIPVTLTVMSRAVNDSYTATVDSVLTVDPRGVLNNDSVYEGSLTADLQQDVQHGKLELAADGSFVYTPTAGFKGADNFKYRAYDGVGYSNVATANINVIEPIPQYIFIPVINANNENSGIKP